MMRLRIRSWSGAEWDGILLRARGVTLRVAVPGEEDVAELWCYGGQWFAENGEPVQIHCYTETTMRGYSAAQPFGGPELGLASETPPWLN